jgi:hypothetical protein
MVKVKVFVLWEKQQIVYPCYKTYGTIWLREMTLRQMLAHIVGNAMTLDNAEFITLDVVEHSDRGLLVGR